MLAQMRVAQTGGYVLANPKIIAVGGIAIPVNPSIEKLIGLNGIPRVCFINGNISDGFSGATTQCIIDV